MSVRRLAADQPEGFAFTPENLEWAKAQIKKYPEGREASAVLPILWRAQEQMGGWLPEPALRYVADMLGMAYIRVYEVATFYTMFNLAPVGRFYVQVCGTTPCWLRGADAIKAACRKHIGEPGKVTKDGLFSWTEVECLGACVNAPVAQINKYYYEDLTPENFARVLDRLRAGDEAEPGPQNGRQASAPIGGPITLIDPELYRSEEREDAELGGAASEAGSAKPPPGKGRKPRG
jgi:NADH-quinone oxidoreductase subunit E